MCRHSEIAKRKNKFRALVVQFRWAILLLSKDRMYIKHCFI